MHPFRVTSRIKFGEKKLEFSEFIVEKKEDGIWRKCPYCNQKVWDGIHNENATGFAIHLSQKMPGHQENADWRSKYGKSSWQFGTLKS